MKFNAGIAVGQMSGSVGGITASHNKGGPYFRNRAIPTNPSSTAQVRARNDLATLSTAWQSLTSGQRKAWTEWGRQNPITDALGNSILKSGHQSFIGLNAKVLLDGNTAVDSPPVVARPPGFASLVQAGDIGTGNVDLTFTNALESGDKIELWAAVVNSAGISYVDNLYRFIAFSDVDQSSPWDNQTDIEAVLGTLVVGQTLHVKAAAFHPEDGHSSTFLRSEVVITSTV